MRIRRPSTGPGHLAPAPEATPTTKARRSGAETSPEPAPRGAAAPAPPPARFSLQAAGASLVGRAALGLAATGVILGVFLGQPGATIQRQGIPTEELAVTTQAAPIGQQVARVEQALARAASGVLGNEVEPRALRDALGHVDFSVRFDGGLEPPGEGIAIARGTRVSAHLTRWALTLQASPGVSWRVDWLPDPTLRSVTWDFGKAAFTVRAEGPGPDGIYEALIERQLDAQLRDRLPAPMRAPGYNPWTDPELEQNLQRLVDLFAGPSSSGGAPARPTATAPHLGFSVRVPEALSARLDEGEATVHLEAGTHVRVEAETEGDFDALRLRSLRFALSGTPLRIALSGDPDALLSRIEVRSLTIRPGGQVDLDYSLGAEQAVDGVKVLVALAALLADPRLAHSSGTLSSTRLEGLRARVQAEVDERLEPQLAALVRENDRTIPGLSLVELFGLER